MTDIETSIRKAAMARLANIFKISVTDLKPEDRFGVDLKSSFVSDFKDNEFDQVNDDILDVADKSITKEIKAGKLVINTVLDYCDHMVRCNQTKPRAVKTVLSL